jgi:hypothetical protein
MGYMKELQLLMREGLSEPNLDVFVLARKLGGDVTGTREIAAPVPGGGEMTVHVNRDGSLYIYDCSGSWKRAKQLLAPLSPPPDPLAAFEKLQRVFQIWEEGSSVPGTPVETYLRSRSITTLPPNVDEVLRWHPSCPFGNSRAGCMLALFRDVESNQTVALHRTNLATRERRALGSIKGTAIKLWPGPEDGRLVVGEGIETVLSAAAVPWREPLFPAWAATVAFNIRKLPVVPGAERLIILVDNDQSGAGQSAAAECRRRWVGSGRGVARLTPLQSGEDFNDVAKRVVQS